MAPDTNTCTHEQIERARTYTITPSPQTRPIDEARRCFALFEKEERWEDPETDRM